MVLCCFGAPATAEHLPGAGYAAQAAKDAGEPALVASLQPAAANGAQAAPLYAGQATPAKAGAAPAPAAVPAMTNGNAAGTLTTQQPGATQPAVSSTLKSLSANEANAVQDTLLKVSALIQKFAEGRSERTTPVQAMRRSLNLVTADCRAKYASVSVLSENQDSTLLIAAVGVQDSVHENNRLLKFPGSGSAVETIVATGVDYFTWSSVSTTAAPTDWAHLATAAGLHHLSAVPIRLAEKAVGVLTVGFEDPTGDQADTIMWPTYLQLIASSIASMVKDNCIPKYMVLVKDLHDSNDIDTLMHKVAQHLRIVLGHSNNHHVWYRIGLTAPNNSAATIFDDLTQVPAPLMQRTLSNPTGSSSFKLLKEVQAAGGVMRTVVAMKNTVMKIAVHNRQQVMIPDVQKVINQSGNVSADIFNTRLIKPPTSVLVFPLKVKQHIFGVIFCMSSVQTDFSDVSPKLRETCEIMSPHLLYLLASPLSQEYKVLQSQSIASTSNAGNSVDSLSGRAGGSMGRSDSLGVSLSGDSFMYNQSRSSTGALVTGLTEKLNQKRIRSSMDFNMNNNIGDLQITNLLGEGGFAKVFRGLWRGLVVGVKVVCDDGKNEKMVMKNAHEIAILSALSHPNIMQAYYCLTDVLVKEFMASCLRYTNQIVLSSPPFKYLASMEDKTCHLEVIEYCDLGNLSNALKNNVFLTTSNNSNNNSPQNGDAGAVEANGRQQQSHRVNMRALTLTLIEIASAMAYLHRMGVVHCDLKPANVLLKSSNADSRGFTAKVSDFGLSRVEDDDMCSSFPFNSCGTAAYVAPEALICNKKVNASVDVYAFGILSWEMYTGQRPYGNMKQQQLVEEVVMRGLRPKFPSSTPAAYVHLAQSCWSGSPQARPSFDEALTSLNNMLQAIDDRELDSMAHGSFASGTNIYEYMGQQGPALPPQQLQQQQGVGTHGSSHASPADSGSTVGLAGGGAAGAGGQRRASNLGPSSNQQVSGGGLGGAGGQAGRSFSRNTSLNANGGRPGSSLAPPGMDRTGGSGSGHRDPPLSPAGAGGGGFGDNLRSSGAHERPLVGQAR